MTTPSAGSDALLFCDSMHEMLRDSGSDDYKLRRILSGANVFFDWGRESPIEALRFASTLASAGAIESTESMALCLAYLGALRAMGRRSPIELSTEWTPEMDDEGGMEDVLRPCMELRASVYDEDIPGFGKMPRGFAVATAEFMFMMEEHWRDQNCDIQSDRDAQLDPDAMVDEMVSNMNENAWAFPLETGATSFKRIKAFAGDAALQATLERQIEDPKTSPVGGLRI